MDLLLVQDLVGAIRAADAEAGAQKHNPLTPLPTIESRRHIHPEPKHEARCVEHLQVCHDYCGRESCEPRENLHSLPRIALENSESNTTREGSITAENQHEFRIEPPWGALPWKEPVKPPDRVKVVQYRTDIVSKGSLIDLFI